MHESRSELRHIRRAGLSFVLGSFLTFGCTSEPIDTSGAGGSSSSTGGGGRDPVGTSTSSSGSGGAASSTLTASIQATRVSGPAPLAVLFDSTATTTATPTTDTFRELTYDFDFGDVGSGTWAISGKSKNAESGGPLAAHVFDTPGTYVVKVRAANASGGYSDASVTITVTDPTTVFTGTKTICVSPAANYTGCPSGATKQTTLPSNYNGKRVLLHKGESFGDITITDGMSNVIVASYGSGAKPIVTTVQVGAWRPATANFATEVVVMDLNVTNSMSQSLGSRVLFYRNDVHGADGNLKMTLGDPYYWYAGDPYRVVPQSAFYNAREIFFVENDALGTGPAGQGAYGSASQSALLGNTYGNEQQHSVRLTAFHKGVIAHNEIQGISSDGIRHALKLHSGGLNPYADGFINDNSGEGGWASSQIVVADNLFGNAADNNDWTIGLSPQNGEYAEGVEDAIVENNRFVHGIKTSTDVIFGGRRLTTRGNTVVGGGALLQGVGHDGALPDDWKGPYYNQ